MKKDIAETFRNIFRLDNMSDEEYENDYEEADEDVAGDEEKVARASERKAKNENLEDEKKETKMFRPARRKSSGSAPKARIIGFQPEELDDRSEIADHVKDNYIVLVDYTKVSDEVMNRINDYLYGVVYSLDSQFVFLSNKIVLISPEDIAVSGKFHK